MIFTWKSSAEPLVCDTDRIADQDPRLAWAVERASDGQITQYLAGRPALLQRFETAPPAAKVLIMAAMDARRRWHQNVLPLSLVERAATAYLPDIQWHPVPGDWLEPAIDYVSEPQGCLVTW